MNNEALAERLPESPTVHIGRPRKFQDIQTFQAAIDAYFKRQQRYGKPFTMHGLARALECSRQTIINYERYDDAIPFVDAIKSARERVAEWTEEGLWRKGQHPAGPIFSLKNNFGWQDVQSMQVNVGVSIGIQADEAERRAMVPVVIVQQPAIAQSPESLDKVGYDHRIEPLSPPVELAPALSPELESAVSDVQTKAKATPTRGVSPPKVA